MGNEILIVAAVAGRRREIEADGATQRVLNQFGDRQRPVKRIVGLGRRRM